MSSTDFSTDFISANFSKVQSFNFSTAELAINKKQNWNEFQGMWLNIKIFNISQESFLLTQICQVNGGFTMTWYHTRELLLKPLPLHSTASMGDALIVRPCEAFPWSYGDASIAEKDAGTCTQRLKNRDSGIWIFMNIQFITSLLYYPPFFGWEENTTSLCLERWNVFPSVFFWWTKVDLEKNTPVTYIRLSLGMQI